MADCGNEKGQGDSANNPCALECAIQFLQKYPEFTEFVLSKSSYKFDIHALIDETKRLDLRTAVEDIRSEFDANGTSSELYDADQSDAEQSQDMSSVLSNLLDTPTADNETKTEEPINESSERNVFQDITKQLNKKRNLRRNQSENFPKMQLQCVFCFNNGAEKNVYASHNCKDKMGNVTCPVLQKFVCSRCHATGSNAHTAKYCPFKPIITPEDCLAMEQKWLEKRRRCTRVQTKGMKEEHSSKPSVQTKSRSRLRF